MIHASVLVPTLRIANSSAAETSDSVPAVGRGHSPLISLRRPILAPICAKHGRENGKHEHLLQSSGSHPSEHRDVSAVQDKTSSLSFDLEWIAEVPMSRLDLTSAIESTLPKSKPH